MIKTIGCCTKCDKEVFDVVERFPPDHENAGKPRRVGQPLPEARRINFSLSGGPSIDLTFCDECSLNMTPDDYGPIWQKVLDSWIDELGDERPDWFVKMQETEIIGVVEKKYWTDVMKEENG